jgi:hypothetical protein
MQLGYGNVWDLLFNGTRLSTINGICYHTEEKLRDKMTNWRGYLTMAFGSGSILRSVLLDKR